MAKESMFEVDAGAMPMPMLAQLGNSYYLDDAGRKSKDRESVNFVRKVWNLYTKLSNYSLRNSCVDFGRKSKDIYWKLMILLRNARSVYRKLSK